MHKTQFAALLTESHTLVLDVWRQLVREGVQQSRHLKTVERKRKVDHKHANVDQQLRDIWRMGAAQAELASVRRRLTALHLIRAIKHGKRHLAGEAEQKTMLWSLLAYSEVSSLPGSLGAQPVPQVTPQASPLPAEEGPERPQP